jgi:uncharacterized protein YjbJ (UPF0337 family)
MHRRRRCVERRCVPRRWFHDDPNNRNNEDAMNKDRIQGSATQAKGKVKEVAGKVTGDTKLESEGKAEKAAGKIQNTVGGLKDTVKEAVDDWRWLHIEYKSPAHAPGFFVRQKEMDHVAPIWS